MTSDPISEIADRLEQAAARLRDGNLDPEEAAALVESCARMAAEAGAQLDRLARETVPPGQEPLTSRQEPLL